MLGVAGMGNIMLSQVDSIEDLVAFPHISAPESKNCEQFFQYRLKHKQEKLQFLRSGSIISPTARCLNSEVSRYVQGLVWSTQPPDTLIGKIKSTIEIN